MENPEDINTSAPQMNKFLNEYEEGIDRYLTKESKERIIKVFDILIGTMYFPKWFHQFQVRWRWEKSIIFHTAKAWVVLKIPVQWTDNKELDMNEARKERYNHESFYFWMWSIYEFDKDKQFFRVPDYYQEIKNNDYNESWAILMSEVKWRSLFFFALIEYLKVRQEANFKAIFPNGRQDYLKIKNDDDLAKLFGIKDLKKTLEDYWENDTLKKKKYLDWYNILEEIIGKEQTARTREFFEEGELLKRWFQHGDLHPGNILLEMNETTGTVEHIYLIDFWNSRLWPQAIGEIKAGKAYWEKMDGLYSK